MMEVISHDCPGWQRSRTFGGRRGSFVVAVFGVEGSAARRRDIKYHDGDDRELERLNRQIAARCRYRDRLLAAMVWGGRLVLLFNPRSETGAGEIYQLCRSLAREPGLRFCAVTMAVSDPGEISFQYDEAVATLEKRGFISPEGGLFRCGDHMPNTRLPLNSTYKNAERSLFLDLVNSDFDRAEQSLRELLALAGDGDYVDVNMFKAKLFYSIEQSAYLLGFRIGREDILSDVAPDFLGRFDRCATADQLLSCALEFIALLKEQLQIFAMAGLDYVQKAEALARQSYLDPQTSMTRIAAELGVNVSQLSKSFKKEKNINLSDYILNLRTDHARELLENSSASIEQIAESSGFGSVKALYRAFDKLEGVTPSVYRKSGGTLNK